MVTEKKKEVLINKFAIEDSYIFKYAINLPYFLKNAYGINNMYKKLVYKKLERIQKLDTVHSDLFFSTTTKFFRLYIPVNKDMRYRYYAHLYYLFYIKLYRSYRQILGLPSHGQRTRSNANTSFRNNTELKRLVVIKAWQSYPFLTKTYAMTAALAELSNKL
jgi:ribosomal protein S13